MVVLLVPRYGCSITRHGVTSQVTAAVPTTTWLSGQAVRVSVSSISAVYNIKIELLKNLEPPDLLTDRLRGLS